MRQTGSASISTIVQMVPFSDESYISDLVLKHLSQGSRMSLCECVPDTTVSISFIKDETKALRITCSAMLSKLHPPLCAEQLTVASQSE